MATENNCNDGECPTDLTGGDEGTYIYEETLEIDPYYEPEDPED